MSHEAWHADIIINEIQVKNCLATQFPELSPLKEIICVDAGWDNLVFLVNQKIIFRFPRRKISVALIEQENQVLKNLQSYITLQIPNPEFIGHPSKDFPYPFHGYALIPGVAAERADLTLPQRIASLKPLTEFLSQLHAIDSKHAANIGAKIPVFDRTQIQKTIAILQERVQKILALNIYKLNAQRFQQELNLIQEIKLPANQHCLIHGDLYCRHLIFNDKRLTGIIDWGDVAISHKSVDLAVIWSFFPASCHQEFLQCYGSVDAMTWQYARFLGLYSGFTLVLYGHAIEDKPLIKEALASIKRINPDLFLQIN